MRGAWIEICSAGALRWKKESLPVRGAWIEIIFRMRRSSAWWVAPCEGSVDWNIFDGDFTPRLFGSLPVRERRGWNGLAADGTTTVISRSLCGERGLKFVLLRVNGHILRVVLCKESVDWNHASLGLTSHSNVAPYEESMDWNIGRNIAKSCEESTTKYAWFEWILLSL